IGDDWHHNGALFLTHLFNYLGRFERPRPEPTRKFEARFEHDTQDGHTFFLNLGPLPGAATRHFKAESPFWDESLRHEAYDEFWKARNLRPHLKDVRPAVLTVGGWFDPENLFGALQVYKTVKQLSPRTSNRLVMGPWDHGGWSGAQPGKEGSKLGDVVFNANT